MMLAREVIRAGNEYRVLRRKVPVGVIRSRAEYDRATAMLDAIIDEIGQDEKHTLAELAEALSVFIAAYEETHYPIPAQAPREVLRYLMEENGVTQSGLPEIGSQGVVSEILAGKRNLNVRQITRLARRFRVSPAVFLED